MNDNKTVGTASEAPTVPGVDVKIFSPKNPEKDHGKLLAFASVNLGGVFAVNNIRIYATEKGPFVAMASTKGQDGKYHDVCCPTTKEMRAPVRLYVLERELYSTPTSLAPGMERNEPPSRPSKTISE